MDGAEPLGTASHPPALPFVSVRHNCAAWRGTCVVQVPHGTPTPRAFVVRCFEDARLPVCFWECREPRTMLRHFAIPAYEHNGNLQCKCHGRCGFR